MGMISLDTETTGLDLRHGAKPYLVTTCNEDMENIYWEWDVDPYTREPKIPRRDLNHVKRLIKKADLLVLQNPKFDVCALAQIGINDWPWHKTRDTLMAGHLLASNQPHDLATMALIYADINIQPLEDTMKGAVDAARSYIRREFKKRPWRLAQSGLPEMPSVKGSNKKRKARGGEECGPWKHDAWVPRTLASQLDYPKDHSWWGVTSDYANGDSSSTLLVYLKQEKLLKERGLWKIYLESLKLLPVIYAMESHGVTLNVDRCVELIGIYEKDTQRRKRICLRAAGGQLKDLPKGSRSKALTNVLLGTPCEDCNGEGYLWNETGGGKKSCTTCFGKGRHGGFGLVSNKTTPKGAPCLDKEVLEHWSTTLNPRSKACLFVRNLREYRKRATALSYLRSYEKFCLPTEAGESWQVLHPSLNPTGTSTLRCSSNNPNEQNISKKEGFNLRYVFGPLPGREWWSLDAKNIELRIPAYECGEPEVIELFEHPNIPPYYGSAHLLNFSTIYPEIWEKELDAVGFEKVGPHCKKKYESTWYQWCKNFDFAVQYGAVLKVDSVGTADRAAHKEGAHALVKARFGKLDSHNQACIDFAKKHGYIETIPDKNVDKERGYPLLCTRNRWGGVKPTIPLNYRTQGTAMWWMRKGMVRCHAYLQTLPDHHMVMQVHDELVFDMPKRRLRGRKPWEGNRTIAAELKRLMELGGEDIGLPTPVSVTYHEHNWSEGLVLSI